jgi:flagellar biosynthetic protein FliS
MYKQFAQTYQKIALESAPPPLVLNMLFERLYQDIDGLASAIEEKDYQLRAKMLDHACRIIEAFRISLDHSLAPELCARLDGLYEYVSHQLQSACLTQKKEPLQHAKKSVKMIQEAFQQAGNP